MRDLMEDLARVIARHPEATGLDFLKAADAVASGFFPEEDLVNHEVVEAFMDAFRGLLDRAAAQELPAAKTA